MTGDERRTDMPAMKVIGYFMMAVIGATLLLLDTTLRPMPLWRIGTGTDDVIFVSRKRKKKE